jgi:two-component system, cell cycle sensor histidine kinase and response regulator CckA
MEEANMLSPGTEPVSPDGGAILVVDDEETARVVIARLLTEAGFVTVQVSNARDALRVLERADPRFELVVVDVVMPETDGRTLGRLIGERHPGLAVLYVSGYPEHDVFHRGAPSPLAPFLQKPFTSDALLGMVRTLLKGGGRLSTSV